MSILPDLIDIYRSAGYEPLTGYNPHHFAGWMDAPFTVFMKDNAIQGTPGLALQEIMVIEGFARYLSPSNVLLIGNALGWSAIALALIFPAAKILAIDPAEGGNALTNGLARKRGLNLEAALGESPKDVKRLCAAHLNGPPDIVLIDAIHTNEALRVDFEACRPESHEGTIWFLHDVLNWNMVEAFKAIRRDHGLAGLIMTRTPSGAAVAWRKAPPEFERYVSCFGEPPGLFQRYRQFIVENVQDKVHATIKGL